MKRTFLTAAVATVAALATAACAAGGSQSSSAGQTPLTLGIWTEVSSWDPAQAHVGHLLQPYQLAYDTLILRRPDGSFAPMLATKWDYTDDTNTVFRLTLRDDVTFSDGEKFNAAAVKANLEHFAKDNGKQASQVAAVESVTAVDDVTVEIKLKQPDPTLEYHLSQAAGLMGSPKSLGSDAMDRLPVGTGPYMLNKDESVVGSQYVFTPRQGYWNSGLQKFGTVTLKLLPDATSRVNALVSGAVDAVGLDPKTAAQAEARGLAKLKYPVDWSGLLLFDRDGKTVPALRDVKVRQAINYAFNREALLKTLAEGQGAVTSQVFGPDSTGFVPQLDNHYTYDPAKAKALLAEAGYAGGFDIEMPVISGFAETHMTFVSQQLAEVGIRVKQTSVPPADYQALLGQGKFPAAWFQLFQGPSWVAVTQLIVPQTLYNPFKTTDPAVTSLIAAVRKGGAEGAAAKKLNTYVTENAWFVPWFRPDSLYYYDKSKVSVEAQTQMAVPSIYNYGPPSP